MKPSPLLITLGTITLIVLTITVVIGGITLASALVPEETQKEGRLGLLLLFPLVWGWKRFLIWCGVAFK